MLMTKNQYFSFSDGHWTEDDRVAFSPDGCYLLSISRLSDGIRIWDLSTGRLVQTLEGHEGRVAYAVYHPSGSHVVSLSYGGELFIWDLIDGTFRNLALIKEKITQFWLSSDGSSLYLFDNVHSFQVMNLHDVKDVKYYIVIPTEHLRQVFPLDNSLLLYADDPHTNFSLYERSSNGEYQKSSGKHINELKTRKMIYGHYPDIQISKYGNYVAESVCTSIGPEGEYYDGEAKIWNLSNNTLVRELNLGEPMRRFTISSNGRYYSNGKNIWNIHTGECVFTAVSNVCSGFSPDERYAIILPKTGEEIAYRVALEDMRKDIELLGGHGGRPIAKSYLANGCCLTTDYLDDFILVWDLDSASVRHGLGFRFYEMKCEVVFLSRDGNFAVIQRHKKYNKASGKYDKDICLWDLLSGDLVFESLEFHDDAFTITPDQNFLLSKSLLVDTNKNKIVRKFENHAEYCNPICLSENGYLVLSGNNDGSIVFWSLLTGDELGRLRDQDNASFSYFEISRNNRYFFSLGSAKGIQVWNLEAKTLHQVFDADKKVFCASFILGEKYIVSGSEDNKVKIWSVETGKIAYEAEQPEKVISLFVPPDNTLIYLSSESGVTTWDLKIE